MINQKEEKGSLSPGAAGNLPSPREAGLGRKLPLRKEKDKKWRGIEALLDQAVPEAVPMWNLQVHELINPLL